MAFLITGFAFSTRSGMPNSPGPFWTWQGVLFAGAGLAMFAWVAWRIDYPSFLSALEGARVGFVALLALAILFEQWMGAIKWRMLLDALGPTRLLRVFAAYMASTLGNYVLPVAGGPIMRSWLVARGAGLPFASVFATMALDRLLDGVAFVAIAVLALVLIATPQGSESVRAGLIAGVAGAVLILALFVYLLALFRRNIRRGQQGAVRLVAWVPARWRQQAQDSVASFAQGVAWPHRPVRSAAILLCALFIKVIAAAHLLWAGLALNVSLGIEQYVLLLVLLGFVVVLTRFVRIPGSFLLAAAFLLELMGVDRERALAMALITQVCAIITINATATAALAWFGAELKELRSLYASGAFSGKTPPP